MKPTRGSVVITKVQLVESNLRICRPRNDEAFDMSRTFVRNEEISSNRAGNRQLSRERGTMSENISTYTDATFDEQIGSSSVPVVVDFWAEWCGPCKMIAPILEEIADEQAGSLAIAKLNVDDNPDIARRFGVMSIPTMIVFKDGQEAARIVGAKGKSQLLEDFKPFL